MPDLPTSYSNGTIAVGAGSTAVTGTGTSWIAAGLEAGDILWAAGLSVRIASVNSATSLTLAYPWPGAALSGANYEVRFTPDATRVLSSAREVLSALTNGNLSSLAGLTTSANKLAYYTGAGTSALTTLSAFARTLLDDADQAAMRTTLGLVPTGSATDTTTGRLVRTGDFGLGTGISLGGTDNLDNILVSGFFYNPASANTAGNNYPLTSAGALIVAARASVHVVQKFISYSGASTATGVREFSRSYGSSGWSPWVEVFNQGTLLGTVSQTGGVPTGRVIERGSNANGEYVRFADGTQICWKRVTLTAQDINTAYGSLYRSGSLLSGNTALAATFTGVPTTTITAQVSDVGVLTVVGGTGDSLNTPATVFVVYTAALTGRTIYVNAVTIGRWF